MHDLEGLHDANVALAFSTWVYLLHATGVEPADDDLRRHCEAVDEATEAGEGDAAGLELVRRVDALLGDGGVEPAAAVETARRLYGERVAADLGQGDRESRVTRIRKYQFGRNLPWLARIWERHPDGRVAPSWLLVERVTDEVRAMDPNPWNDVDEERRLPVGDFQVLWELDGCPSVYLA